jgi:hypothetical protein
MSLQRMDADTPETLAGVVRLLRRAAELVGRLSTPTVPDRLARCWRWAPSSPPTRGATSYRKPFRSKGL